MLKGSLLSGGINKLDVVYEPDYILMMKQYYYYLGLISADGYLTRYGVGLDLIDKEIILKCAEYFKCNTPKEYNSKFRVLVPDEKLRTDLILLGIRNPLKINMSFPEIDSIYLREYIHGYFDGDGCFTNENNGGGYFRNRVHIRGTEKFITGLRETLGYGSVYTGKTCSSYYVSNKKDVLKFFNYLYENSEIDFIKRKKKVLYK